jgi:hypothetical protein
MNNILERFNGAGNGIYEIVFEGGEYLDTSEFGELNTFTYLYYVIKNDNYGKIFS